MGPCNGEAIHSGEKQEANQLSLRLLGLFELKVLGATADDRRLEPAISDIEGVNSGKRKG